MRIITLTALLTLSTITSTAYADYFLVYGYPEEVAVSCDHHRVIHRHYYHHVRHRHHYHVVHQRRSGYSMTVYYPLPAYAWAPPPCCCCGESTTVRTVYVGPSYPAGVYFVKPDDRIVGNDWDNDPYYGNAMDTGTADNDVY
jgi:hypothetical protein